MTIVTGGPGGIDMSTWPALLSSATTSTTVTSTAVTDVLANGDTEIFTGSFQLTDGQVTGGTETGFALYTQSGKLIFSLSNADIPASTFTSFEQSGNMIGLVQAMLTGHDTYMGSPGTDDLIGYGGNDTFIGAAGAELFQPAAGNNTIVGGKGINAVLFKGPSTDYAITDNGDGSITVTDSVATRNGTDHIADVQLLQFTDKVVFDLTPDEARIALLFQGALGRIPDNDGLRGWEKLFGQEPQKAQDSDNFTALAGTSVGGLSNLASGFTNSDEFKQKFGTLTDAQFVAQLYANILDRAPDDAGLNGWMNALANGHSREWVLVGFAESAEAVHNAEVGFVGQSGTVHPGWLVMT
jgi:Ca2+-binding RTX toxin-like protein